MSDSHPQPARPPDPRVLWLDFHWSESGTLRAIVTGEIDFASASSLQARVTAACERHGAKRLILDLEGVEFMDSSGLRAILHLQRELAGEEGALVLLGPTPEVRNVLTLTGLDRHLAVAETLAQAEALLQRSEDAGANR